VGYFQLYFLSFSEFESIDRNKVQAEHVLGVDTYDMEFDTTIHGPWMERWEIVNHNRHTDQGLHSHKA
jgi:hypothetical protein